MNLATNRRSLLKMTNALAAATAAATTREQIATYAAFMREVDAYGATFPQDAPEDPDNPASFAEAVELGLSVQFDELSDAVEPELWAAWKQAEVALQRAVPDLAQRGRPGAREWEEFSSDTFAWALAMFRAGVRRGAVMEHLRLDLATPTVVCWDCFGAGVIHHSHQPIAEASTCPTCHGVGTMPRPAGSRMAWHDDHPRPF